ncbi:efflux RND transporter periplasmic adaptor subunit [Mucilaginibacter ginsenosidivorax]|nr:efflux RND transporter periplasmic adaptor subunit [Mucilaginibacter ginsenosidivorax]
MKALNKIFTVSLLVMHVLLSACSNPKPAPAAQKQAKSDVKYTCPMHHQIMENSPGSCPICGMTLVRKTGQAGEEPGVSLGTVLQPVNSSVVSSVPAITPVQRSVATEINGDGYLDFDTRTFNNIASRFSGRIEKLYIRYAFQEIHAGERVFDIYSPDMVTAQQDLVYLTRNPVPEPELVNAARQKLLLLGMTMAQVNQVAKTGKAFYSLPVYSPYTGHVHDTQHSQMAGPPVAETPGDLAASQPLTVKEGMYVTKGQTLFNVVNPHSLWAIVKIDRSSVSALKLNQQVQLQLPDMPGKTIIGKVNFIEPVLQQGDKTTSIRVYVDNMDHSLKVNTLVKAKIQTGIADGLWIPREAVVDLGQTQVVWLKKGAAYRARQVSTGLMNGNYIQVAKGLMLTDSLASNAQYLTDSENFIKVQSHEQ